MLPALITPLDLLSTESEKNLLAKFHSQRAKSLYCTVGDDVTNRLLLVTLQNAIAVKCLVVTKMLFCDTFVIPPTESQYPIVTD